MLVPCVSGCWYCDVRRVSGAGFGGIVDTSVDSVVGIVTAVGVGCHGCGSVSVVVYAISIGYDDSVVNADGCVRVSWCVYDVGVVVVGCDCCVVVDVVVGDVVVYVDSVGVSGYVVDDADGVDVTVYVVIVFDIDGDGSVAGDAGVDDDIVVGVDVALVMALNIVMLMVVLVLVVVLLVEMMLFMLMMLQLVIIISLVLVMLVMLM